MPKGKKKRVRSKLAVRLVVLDFNITASNGNNNQLTPALDADYWFTHVRGNDARNTNNTDWRLRLQYQAGGNITTEVDNDAIAAALLGSPGSEKTELPGGGLWVPKGTRINVTVTDIGSAAVRISVVFWAEKYYRRRKKG